MISIENSIFKGLLYDQIYAGTVYPYLDEQFFDGPHKILYKVYKELFDKYNVIPNLEALAVTLQKQEISDQEFESVIDIVEEISTDLDDKPDRQWLIDETEEYCKDKAIYNAIYQSISIIDGSDKDKSKDKNIIPELLDAALSISFDNSIGMDYFDDASRRYDILTAEENTIKFPLEVLNHLSNGGLRSKSLSCILGFTNTGKSSIMCYLAGEFMKMGKNVLYISMEMSEELVLERVDANLLNVTTNELKKLKKEDYLNKVNKVKNNSVGKLIVKEYPTSGAHAGHFKHLLKELKQKKLFAPDVIFVDYINICASSRYRTLNGVNSYSYIKAIAEELRGLAVEFDVPVMTATQINRDGAKSENPDMTATSESMGLPSTLDFFFAITTSEVLQDNNQQLFHLLKTRWGNKSRIKPQLVNIDFDKMRYSDPGSMEDIKSKMGQNKPEIDEHKNKGIEWE